MLAKFNYLDSLKNYLRLNPVTESDIIREIDTHLEDKSQELRKSGLSEEEASETAIHFMGPPRLIAKQIYEVYSQGSWRQAFYAALPHFLIALLFALQWWQSTIWVSAILFVVISVVIYGWCHGKPDWLFPWLGYCLIPVLIAGFLLIYLPGGWAWLAALAYIPLALFVIVSITKQTIKRDWLFASLMLLPIPIVLGWILALGKGDSLLNGFLRYEQLYEAAPWVALSFVFLAITVATFIRIKQRWAKVGILIILEILILTLVASAIKNSISFWGWLLLISLSSLLLLSPILLERKIRQV